MAATLTETRTAGGINPIERISLAWVSHTDGSGTLTTGFVTGTILRVEFKPDSGGTQPSDLYDITLTDTSGVDVLSGLGANLSNATATTKTPIVTATDGTNTIYVPFVVAEALTLNITNAGSGKGGKVILYTR